MKKAGGIIAIIAGVFAVFAAGATLFVGGVGAGLEADGAGTVIGLGWGGLVSAFLVIILGAIAIGAKGKAVAYWLMLVSFVGVVIGGTLVAVFMAPAFIGGLLMLFEKAGTQDA